MSIDGIEPGWIVNWSPGILGNSETISITPDQATTYTATVTDPEGCVDEVSFDVNVIIPPGVPGNTRTIFISSDRRNDDLSISPLPEDLRNLGLNVSWNNGQLNLSDPFAPILIGGLGEGRDSLLLVGSVSDNEGCYNEQFLRIIRIISVPNIFSPGNNDDRNDFFNIIGDFDPTAIESLRVFNRWGQKVYDNDTPNRGWDGTFNNEQQPPGVYVYFIEIALPEGGTEVLRGDVTLVR